MTDYAADVAKYASIVDTHAVSGIVRHLGIALKSRDAANVACSSKSERARVRDGFLKRTLGLADSDGDLDAAIIAACQRMKSDRSKSRVTLYYLLAERFGKLESLR